MYKKLKSWDWTPVHRGNQLKSNRRGFELLCEQSFILSVKIYFFKGSW